MMDATPNWEEIKTFAALAQANTVRQAARALQVHHSTVSRRLEHLESSLETRLFDRHPDAYVLTTSGERLFKVARCFHEELSSVSREVAGKQDRLAGTLRVTMPAPLASLVIAPQLQRFSASYPGIEVQVVASYTLLDISRREADIAIRMDNNPPDVLVGKRIFRYHQAPYATREYLEKHDLENHPETARLLGWEKDSGRFPPWTKGTGCEGVPVWGYFPEPNVQLAAAKGGLGIALLPCLIADQDEELVRATRQPPIEARDIWLLTHRDLIDTSRIRVFMEFAEDVLRSLEPAMRGEGGKRG